MDYFSVKLIHQGAVALSLTGFFVRGAASLMGAGWVNQPPARTIPHIVDSVLLLSALVLASMIKASPETAPWLLAKIIGLLVYIGLCVVALRPGRPRSVRLLAWLAALLSAGWIVSVALSKSPLGFFGALA